MPRVENKPVLMIMGPTATGKTAFAIEAAQRLGGEIISVDSALIYRGMDIGTAKPSEAELSAAPHHLINICDPLDSYSAAQFRADALVVIEDIQERGKLPILAGGTMLYFRALLDGIAQMPPSDEVVRAALDEQLKEQGAQALHDELASFDPEAAQRIHVNDPQRLLRAIEVYRISGKSLSDYHAEQKASQLDSAVTPAVPYQGTSMFPYPHLKVGLIPDDRARHRKLVAQRFDQMLEQGFVNEVRSLHQHGDLHLDLPSMRCVGYRQAWQYIEGDLSQAEMRERAVIATRQLAKRQMTWLRKEEKLQQWNCFKTDRSELLENVSHFVKSG